MLAHEPAEDCCAGVRDPEIGEKPECPGKEYADAQNLTLVGDAWTFRDLLVLRN